jgi:hypothetical protein
MTQHNLQGRSEQELLWFQQRRSVLAAAAWSAAGGFSAALAQERSNIVEIAGDATVNGTLLTSEHSIQTGDDIATGPGAHVVFVIGNSAFHVRQNSNMRVLRGDSITVVGVLRLITGAVISAWGKGNARQIVTPTLTAGIRGTGVYAEIFATQDMRSYFCNCYGTVDLGAGNESLVSQSQYHQSFWAEPYPKNGRYLTPGKAINHTDEELEFLAGLIGQKTAWQISGKKGVKDGKGYMQDLPGQMHPAEMPVKP